ncbi:MAG: hypothetical protein JRM73_03460 [Nitrososphaerota archaeon]|nr:hypothetical protein [Nitrososphaerota archaeon]
MNLTELESIAAKLLDEQNRLKSIDAELGVLSQEIKQDPKRNEKERAFYELIGMDWSDPGHKERSEALKRERDVVRSSIRDNEFLLSDGLSSQPLVVPLDPVPERGERTFTFRFRSGATFPKTVQELSATLGIPSPLRIGEVTIHPEMVVVSESDEYFAKKKIVEAFEDLRKEVKRKLSP